MILLLWGLLHRCAVFIYFFKCEKYGYHEFMGFKSSIVKGLMLSAMVHAMIIAVNGAAPGDSSAFNYILGALFIVGLGFSLQQPLQIHLRYHL